MHPTVPASIAANASSVRSSGSTRSTIVCPTVAATRLADVVYVVESGEVVFRGSAGELDAEEDVKARYLGVGV